MLADKFIFPLLVLLLSMLSRQDYVRKKTLGVSKNDLLHKIRETIHGSLTLRDALM